MPPFAKHAGYLAGSIHLLYNSYFKPFYSCKEFNIDILHTATEKLCQRKLFCFFPFQLGRRLVYRSKHQSDSKHELFLIGDTRTKTQEEEYFFSWTGAWRQLANVLYDVGVQWCKAEVYRSRHGNCFLPSHYSVPSSMSQEILYFRLSPLGTHPKDFIDRIIGSMIYSRMTSLPQSMRILVIFSKAISSLLRMYILTMCYSKNNWTGLKRTNYRLWPQTMRLVISQ